MPISECCTTNVITCGKDMPLPEVAALMRRHHVGDVVVVEGEGSGARPIGIITDRDIVVETIALQLDVTVFTAGDMMSSPLVAVSETDGILESLRLMRAHNIRRLPVLAQSGGLYGIVSADDVFSLLTMELSLMTGVVVDQQDAERRQRRGGFGPSGNAGAIQH
ncbi:CBS domain-containing protein [Noviherbaspirillum humi]|uniref:CBS domain-containing protein n=1 Tax=Noviherbaspirillum humi TaxID=1688639 RepID=A0A239FDN9_9BURK|nr:CBS domain-containing protein [Noviherbaspirillum humi]SNS55046.1 CBS domain-containing protein [Noviherbaspirillum humi]